MRLDGSVKVYNSSVFRPRLSFGDIIKGNGVLVDVCSSNASLYNGNSLFTEKALVFLEKPITVPNLSYRYSTRIWSLKDSIIERCVKDLVFLNPRISDSGICKMVVWMGSYMVGSVKEGDGFKKAVSYEELLPVVSNFCFKYSGGDVDIIETNKVILYKRESLLTKEDKVKYSNIYRSQRISFLKGEIIHEGAIIASKIIDRLLKINKPLVLKYSEDINSIVVLNRYIEPRTISFLEDENNNRYLKSELSYNKYLEFIEMYDGKKSLDRYTHALGISKSTAVEFKNLLLKQKKIDGYEGV
jgi:hypothetical protein